MVVEDYGVAAIRHLTDAELLAEGERWGGAGHLVGFAAECAIKCRIHTIGPTAKPVKGHFPDLIEIAKKHLTGRRDISLHNLLRLPDLMDGWKVELRYAGDAVVGEVEFKKWRLHTLRLIAAANLRRNMDGVR